MAAISSKADITADWKMHMPFDQWPVQVVETPKRVYFLNRTFENRPELAPRAVPSHSLFYYDKEGDEIVSVNKRANSSGNAVACIGYNSTEKYLLVVYLDGNIDFIYDDGRIYNLQSLKASSIQGNKIANSITFDNDRNRAYVATSFGYVALNDSKHEIAESRIYGENVKCVARCGDNIVLATDNELLFAPASSQRFNLTDYSVLEGAPSIGMIIPLKTNDFYGYKTSGGSYLDKFTRQGDSYSWEQLYEDPQFFGVQQNPTGHTVTGNVRLFLITREGEVSTTARPQEVYGKPAATFDKNNLWTLTERKGLRQYKYSDWEWKVVKDYMRPNSPATYISTDIQYHPSYGIIAGSNGVDLAFSDFNQQTPNNLSALKGGLWKEFGPAYTSSLTIPLNNTFSGVAIDPQNNKYVYRTNTLGGLMRINLENPDDILVLANPANRNSSLPGFVAVAENMEIWDILCRFTVPEFTPDGTMWTVFNNADQGRAQLWWWPASDRAATTSPANYRPMKHITLPADFPSGNRDVLEVTTKNKNIIALGGLENEGTLLIYDHNGTPEVTGDDRYVFMSTPYDQDGGGVSFLTINYIKEDPATGLLWLLSQRGVFTVNPATVFDNPNTVNRIKVSRNDGTGLADYLLNEINVNHLSIDAEGRKWFSTSNGLVCTSQDGRTILGEFTTENSYLPGDNVYATCYNPESNSLLVATDGGIVEMFPSGSGSASAEGSTMRVYPNPVEPDYYGWVRIDNIADGSLVKITDAQGGIVKELGPVQGGSVEWDVSGYNNNRVSTGVYYVMVSPGSAGGKTEIAKVLVLN